MSFQWKQLSGSKGELYKWVLIHRDTGRPVLMIALSHYAEEYQNWKLRRKIQRTYERYHRMVWFDKLRFF